MRVRFYDFSRRKTIGGLNGLYPGPGPGPGPGPARFHDFSRWKTTGGLIGLYPGPTVAAFTKVVFPFL